MKRTLLATLVTLVSAMSMAVYTAEATNNGTIQAAGPRGGGNGKAFMNIEGPGNAEQFRSWGVADFAASSFNIGFQVGDISNFKVVLTEANAAFTLPGKLNFWLTSDTTNSIDPGLSPFVWQNDVTPEGVGNQCPTIFLGSGDFGTTGNMNSGQIDTYAIELSPAAKSNLITALNNNGNIRVIITPDSLAGPNTVAATFAGFSHNTFAGPTLEFDASGGSSAETLAPTAEQIVFGTTNSGGNLASWAADDNNGRKVCRFFIPNAQIMTRMRLSYTTTKLAPTAISFNVKISAHTPIVQLVTLRVENKVTNLFVDTNVVLANIVDGSTYNGVPTGTLANYVGGGGAIRGEIEIKQTGISALSFPCTTFEFGQMVVTG